tara:strand:- start:794 stop:1171 length:378 start_codon:yes stop_codon:yes gene_type:complete
MFSKKFNYKDVIEKIVDTPSDNRLKSAKSFWSKETLFFKRLFKKFPSEKFWSSIHLNNTPAKKGRMPSLVFFFDKDNNFWIKILEKKWKDFNWTPPKIKSYEFKKDLEDQPDYNTTKNSLRNFFN